MEIIKREHVEPFSNIDYREFDEANLTFLESSQLIAMIDYPPLHSPEAYTSYLEKFKSGIKVEPAIVVPSELVINDLKKKRNRYSTYQESLQDFLTKHSNAKYFMLGGKHRSSAATILNLKIPCLVVSNDADVTRIHSLMKNGHLTGTSSVGRDFDDTVQELEDHFFEHKRFWTMEEKTQVMKENGDI
ncbi:hypothetical protein ACFLZY_01755 [Patescibacteria group bacterium]